MAARMDAATVNRMAKPVIINDREYLAIRSEFLAEMGPLTGDGISLVVFSDDYQASRNDAVNFEGTSYIVARKEAYNGKWRIWIE
jgi:hypothetical protein